MAVCRVFLEMHRLRQEWVTWKASYSGIPVVLDHSMIPFKRKRLLAFAVTPKDASACYMYTTEVCRVFGCCNMPHHVLHAPFLHFSISHTTPLPMQPQGSVLQVLSCAGSFVGLACSACRLRKASYSGILVCWIIP